MGNFCTSSKQKPPFDPVGHTETIPSPSSAVLHKPESHIGSPSEPGNREHGASESHAEVSHAVQPLAGSCSQPEMQQPVAKENVPPPEDAAPPPGYRARRRGSVSAEVAQLMSAKAAPMKPRKSFETEAVVYAAMKHSFLLTELEEEQKLELISSMFRKPVLPGETIIRQGDEGDNFYVIASGTFTARLTTPEHDEKVVFTYGNKGAFGELALMYNCPRAATVQAETEGVLWGVDRATFRKIILFSRIEKRQRYEEVLSGMSIFSSLSPEQLASIADCLSLEVYEEGQTILKEGEELTSESKFYLVESGTVACYRTFQEEQKLVKVIELGGFFGEVALVTHTATRAADCVAKTKVKLLAMGRDAFERLMGPAEEILKKEVAEYDRINLEMLTQGSQDVSTAVNRASTSKKGQKAASQRYSHV